MSEQDLLPALAGALRTNEIGEASPYRISFAEKGSSGASFGFMQGDMNAGPRYVRECLRSALVGAAMPLPEVDAVMGKLAGRPLPIDPLTANQEAEVNAALASATGRRLVDAMDEHLMQDCLAGLDECVVAAHQGGRRIAPEAQIAITLWINMTGSTITLRQWLGGEAVTMAGEVEPPGEYVSREDILTYLRASHFFTNHPRNITHFEEALDAGSRLLPGGAWILFGLVVGWDVYEQATGRFLQQSPTGEEVLDPLGYSGSRDKEGLNDPTKEYEPFVGPIPHGAYRIGPPYTSSISPFTFRLDPIEGTDTRGRDGLLIHGGCKDGTMRASTGCIIISLGARTKLASSRMTTLHVVHG